jgi:hypothetical protein
MYAEVRCARGFVFVASAEVQGADGVRSARVRELSIAGAYLAMPNPFSKGPTARIKLRTQTDFFQADATVVHSNQGIGMELMFHAVSHHS